MNTLLKLTTLFIFLLSSHSIYGEEKLIIGDFSSQNLNNWKEKEFKNMTIYNFVSDENTQVLKAYSNKSASGLFKEQTIKLKDYPYLNWRWKITSRLNVKDEKTKNGDDYSARIYIIKDGGFFFWKTKALNYVWATHEDKEHIWPNAYAPDNAKMLAIRSRSDALNTWQQEKRNLAEDFKKAFDEELLEIDGIAIMADTDNSLDETTSYFGDIYFSKN